MATPGSQLVLQFKSANNEDIKFTYRYANPDVTSSEVKALVAALITNGEIFAKVPSVAVSAALQTTTSTEIDIAS